MEESVSEQALAGVVSVELSSGVTIDLRPWGFKTGKRMMRQIVSMLTVGSALQAEAGESRVGLIMEKYADDLLRMISETIEVPTADLEDETKYDLADFFGLMDGIVKVNFLSRPGRRLTKNLLALFGTLDKITTATVGGETQPETTTEATPTESPKL